MPTYPAPRHRVPPGPGFLPRIIILVIILVIILAFVIVMTTLGLAPDAAAGIGAATLAAACSAVPRGFRDGEA